MKNTHTLKIQFEIQTKQLNSLLETISEETSIQEFDGFNTIKWLTGHIVNTRLLIIAGLTKQPSSKPEYGTFFGRGSSGKVDDSFPKLDELKNVWLETQNDFDQLFEKMTDSDFEAPSPIPFAISDQTLLGFVTYLVYHEAFHLGQLSIVKRFTN